MPRRRVTTAQVLQAVLSSDEESELGYNYGHDSDFSSEHSSENGDFAHVDSTDSHVSDDNNSDPAPVGRGRGRGGGRDRGRGCGRGRGRGRGRTHNSLSGAIRNEARLKRDAYHDVERPPLMPLQTIAVLCARRNTSRPNR